MQTFQFYHSREAAVLVKELTGVQVDEGKLNSLELGESQAVTGNVVIVRNEHQTGFRVVVKAGSIDRYTTIAAAEASALWQLENSTLRKAIADKRLPAQKSGGTWLVNTADMVRVYGDPKPDTDDPTRDETFFIKGDTEPLEDVGRVPGVTGRHVLMSQDGRIFVIGGYYLRRLGEEWDDWIPEYTSQRKLCV